MVIVNAPRQPVLFGRKGRAALVFSTYAGLVASSICILVGGGQALYVGDAWLEGHATPLAALLALATAGVGVAFGGLSLAMTALLSRGAKPGDAALESWQQAMDITPRFHRFEVVAALVIAAGAWSLFDIGP